jgi:hypothetical protein
MHVRSRLLGPGSALALVLIGALGHSAAAAATYSVLPADGQTVKFRLTGDIQRLNSDSTFNTLLALVRTGDLISITSTPTPGTPLVGNARVLDNGTMLIVNGALAVELNTVNLTSAVAITAPDAITFVTTWNLSPPVYVGGATVDVPVGVVVTDPSPDHLSVHAQGRQSAMLPAGDHQVPGNLSLDYTVNFHNGAFAGARGVVFADASPDTTVHSVINWHLAPAQ